VVAVALLAVSGSLQGGGGKDEIKGDLKKLQGTWKFIVHEMDGKSLPKEDVAKTTITFVGDKWTVKQDDKVVQGGTHKLDSSKKPGQVDAVITEGEGKGGTMTGIYELTKDKLKVCFDIKGKERPTTFSSEGGRMLAVIERQKKAKK
jgi:uncharacterized protein (TIGR03067 family)